MHVELSNINYFQQELIMLSTLASNNDIKTYSFVSQQLVSLFGSYVNILWTKTIIIVNMLVMGRPMNSIKKSGREETCTFIDPRVISQCFSKVKL